MAVAVVTTGLTGLDALHQPAAGAPAAPAPAPIATSDKNQPPSAPTVDAPDPAVLARQAWATKLTQTPAGVDPSRLANPKARATAGKSAPPPMSGLDPTDAAAADPAAQAAVEAARAAAALDAGKTKKPVEVAPLTTEKARTVANPDGTFTSEVSLDPVRWRESDKTAWKDVDLSFAGSDTTGAAGSAVRPVTSASPWAARVAGAADTKGGLVQAGPAELLFTWTPQALTSSTSTSSGTASGTPSASPSGAAEAPGALAKGPRSLLSSLDQVEDLTASTAKAGLNATASAAQAKPTEQAATKTGPQVAGYLNALGAGRTFAVQPTATGAEEFVVLASRAAVTAAGGASAASAYRTTFTVPAGITARQATAPKTTTGAGATAAAGDTDAAATATDAGMVGVEFLDATGAVVASYGGGHAWDSSANVVGEPASAPVRSTLVSQDGTTVVIDVATDATWLAESARVFPVTIDPTFSYRKSTAESDAQDAYVDEAYPSTAEGNFDPGNLKTGRRSVNGATADSQTLLYFKTGQEGSYNNVLSARLGLWNTYSGSCTAQDLDVLMGDRGWLEDTITWNNRPRSTGGYVRASFSYGYTSSCPANDPQINVTPLVQNWFDATANNGFILYAPSSSVAAYKRFSSAESGDNRAPTLTITYEDCSVYSGGYRVCEPIRNHYERLKRNGVDLGAPTSSQATTADGVAFNTFANNAAIYTTPVTSIAPDGAVAVYGVIRNEWTRLGGTASWLGYPLTDEYAIPGGRRVDFQRGSIVYDAASGAARATAGATDGAGAPSWATTSGFTLTDGLSASVDVATGNLNLVAAGLSVPGIAADGGGDLALGAVYNSVALDTTSQDVATGTMGKGWRSTFGPGTRLVILPGGSVRYIDPAGRGSVYSKINGVFESPKGAARTQLTASGSNLVLTQLDASRTLTFRASDGLLISDADRNGITTTFSYNSSGLLSTITGTRGNGNPVTLTYGGTAPAGRLAQMSQTSDGVTRTVKYAYNASTDQLTSIVDAAGRTTTLGYTGDDLTSITTPLTTSGGSAGTTTTQVSYTSAHRVAQLVRDAGSGKFNQTWKYNYIATANTTTVTDPRNGVSYYLVDGFGRVLRAEDPLRHIQQNSYTPNNDVTTATNALNAVSTTTFNNGGFPTRAQLPTGAAAAASYPTTGITGLPGSVTSAANSTTSFVYDSRGNVTSSSNPNSAGTGGTVSATATYNPSGTATCGGRPGQQCTSTDGNGNTTNYTYDSSGNLTRVTPPSAGVIKATTYSYDGAGRRKTATDGKGQTTTYSYDTLDRVTQVLFAGATSCNPGADTCITYTYDAAGNPRTRVDTAGTQTTGFDALGREVSRTLPSASGGATSTLGYDLAGNLTSFVDTDGSTTGYTYDAANNLKTLVEPGGATTSYVYDNADFRTTTTYPGGVVITATPDQSGRVSRLVAQKSGGPKLMDLTYGYTSGASGGDGSLVASRTDASAAAVSANGSGGVKQAYTHDGLDRLTRALETKVTGGAATAGWLYCYDKTGNRTYDTASTTATACGTANAAYDATNALVSRNGGNISYDANGNETSAAASATGLAARSAGGWNSKNQLLSLTTAGTARTNSYAGTTNAERTTSTAGGSGMTTFQNTAVGLSGQSGSNASRVIREPGGALVGLRTGGATYYFLTDILGSVMSVVDNTGAEKNRYSYDPYGSSRAKSETIDNPYQYIGGYLDKATGLYALGARYYDSTLGRFTQGDPSGSESNPYLYGAASPCSSADPSGLLSRSQVRKYLTVCSEGALAGLLEGAFFGAVGGAIAGLGALGFGAIPGALVGAQLGALAGAASGCLQEVGIQGLLDLGAPPDLIENLSKIATSRGRVKSVTDALQGIFTG